MKVLMLVLNTFENDSRVHRAAKTLADRGADVLLLCVHREGLPREVLEHGYRVVRSDLTRTGIAERAARRRAESAGRAGTSSAPVPAAHEAVPADRESPRESGQRSPTGPLRPWTLRRVRQSGRDHRAVVRPVRTAVTRRDTAFLRRTPLLRTGLRLVGTVYWPVRRCALRRWRVVARYRLAGRAKFGRALRTHLRPLGRFYWPIRRQVLRGRRGVIRFASRTRRSMRLLVRNTGRSIVKRLWKTYGRASRGPGPTMTMANGTAGTATGARTLIPHLLRRVLARRGNRSFHARAARYELFGQIALNVAADFRPDIVHAHDFNCVIGAEMIRDTLGIPYVYDSHELWVERNRAHVSVSEAERRWERTTEARALRKALVSMTVCKSIAEHLARNYGVPEPIVIRNAPYRAAAAREPLKSVRRQFQLSASDFIGVYVGRVAENRGVVDILRAMPLIDRRFKFVTMGTFHPDFKSHFDRLVQKLGLQDRVFCQPPVSSEEVSCWIADCDLALTTMNRVCLSYVYALPNKLFESLHAGLPILGPDSPEIERIIDEYGCGLTYRDEDHRDLAAKISDIMRQPERLLAFRTAALAAAESLCWEVEQERFLEAYRIAPLSSSVTAVTRQ
jgi:glycosyltransferase involved in cell wall biosynthesis